MMKRSIYRYLLVASLLFKTNAVLADTSLPNIIRKGLIDQEEQQEFEERQNEIKQLKNYKPSPTYTKNILPDEEEARCIDIKKVNVTGSTIFSQKEILQITKDYESKCLNLSKINNIIEKLNELYFNLGYITSRASLPMPQERLQEGIIDIRITEGYISDFEYNSNLNSSERRKKRMLSTAFPHLKGKILNLRDIEQGIEKLNNLSGNNAKMEISPGKELGETIIYVSNNVSKRGNFEMSFDNSGQSQTGENQMSFEISRDNIFALNESWSISRKKDRNKDDLNYNFTDSFSFSMPFGYYQFDYNLYRSDYKTTSFLNNGDTLEVYGGGTGNSLTLSRTLKRGKIYKSSIETNLNIKRTDSNSEIRETSVKNYVGSRKLSIGKISSSNNIYTDFGTFMIKPSYQFGLNVFGSLDDTTSPLPQEAQYEAYLLYLYYGKSFNLPKISNPFYYNLSFNSQYSEDELFSSESFSIGGEYSVRGFKNTYLQGNSGYSARNELNVPLFKNSINKIPVLKKVNSTLFYDYGMVKNDDKREYMAGSGIKFSYSNDYFNSYLTYAKSLNRPESITEEEEESIYFKVGFGFSTL